MLRCECEVYTLVWMMARDFVGRGSDRRECDVARGAGIVFHTLSNTWELLGSSVHVLGKDKELLLFPIVSGIVSIVIFASFAGGAWGAGLIGGVIENVEAPGPDGEFTWTTNETTLAIVGFLFYLVSYFAVIYFNAALIGAAHIRLIGGNPTVADGFRAANACLGSIFIYALIAATVGLLLKALRDNSNNILARIVVGLIGIAWTLVTFLVVPVIVIERRGAFNAIKRSTSMLRETWGEQIASNLGFGIIGFLFSLPGIAIVALGVWLMGTGDSPVVGITVCALALVYWVGLGIILSTLKGIFVAALYAYAAHEDLQVFPQHVVAGAFGRR